MPWPKAKERAARRSKDEIDVDNAYRRDLIERAKLGDGAAIKEYRSLNSGLEEQILRTYSKWVSASDMDDLRQEGFIGLLKGITAYTFDKSTASGKPEGYVYSWVRAYVSNYARIHGSGKKEKEVSTVPLHQRDEVDEDDILSHVACDKVRADESYESQDLLCKIREILKTLPQKERVIVEQRFLNSSPMTLSAIGEQLGISRERVRQIEMQVKVKLYKRIEHLR